MSAKSQLDFKMGVRTQEPLYFMFIFFFAFYRLGGMNNGPPPPQEPGFHPGDESFAPNVDIPRFPVPAIV